MDNKISSAQMIENSALAPHIAHNIASAHFEIGPGHKVIPTEQQERYQAYGNNFTKNKLSAERKQFFKDSHITTIGGDEPRVN